MRKIFIILCNPKKESFSKAIAQAYSDGAIKSHNEVRLINVYDLEVGYYNFDNELSAELKEFKDNILWADQMVFIYPVWCLSIPAKLKSIIEMTFQEDGCPTTLLKGKSSIVLQSYGMPVFVMKYLMGDVPFKLMKGISKFCGIKLRKRFDFGLIANVTQQKCEKWLKQVENYAAKS